MMGHIKSHQPCWVVSNTERPTKEGIYTTIDSHGIEGETLFDNGHWIIRPDRHPVQMWWSVIRNKKYIKKQHLV